MRFCPTNHNAAANISAIGRLLELPELTLPAVVAEYVHFRRVKAYPGTGGATRLAGQNTGLPRDIA